MTKRPSLSAPFPHRRAVAATGEARRLLVTSAVLWTIYGVVLLVVISGLVLPLDARVIHDLQSLATPRITAWMVAVSALAGDEAALTIGLVVALALYRRPGPGAAGLYVLACLSGWGLNTMLKELAGRARPDTLVTHAVPAAWYSFPSGHAMLSVLLFGFGAVLLASGHRRPAVQAGVVLLGAAVTLAVGISRIYLGAHWPSDVVGGFAAGAAWAATCAFLAQQRMGEGVPRR